MLSAMSGFRIEQYACFAIAAVPLLCDPVESCKNSGQDFGRMLCVIPLAARPTTSIYPLRCQINITPEGPLFVTARHRSLLASVLDLG